MNLKHLLLASVALAAAPVAASAQDAPSFDVSYNIGVTNDYVWRGISQSNADAAIQGGIDVSYGSFYAGTWASNVDFGSDANYEWDVYAGFKPELGGLTFDFGVLAYLYPEEDDLNIVEFKAATTLDLGGLSVTPAVFYSPDVLGETTWYSEVAATAPLEGAALGPFSFSLTGAIGNYSYENSGSYVNWRVGLNAATENGFSLDLGYTDTDVDGNDLADGRFVALAKFTF